MILLNKMFKALFKIIKFPSNKTSKRLHLGCGRIHIDGWCNVDITPMSTVDITDNVVTLKKFKKNFAEEIYVCHVLEHFSHKEIPSILKRWFDILKPGGIIRISVPDIDRIVKIYNNNWEHFQKDGNTPWIGLLYGGQNDKYDYHKTGFNFNWMKRLLTDVGFREIKEYPHEPHFIGGIKDGSLSKEPFGEYISLNIKAKK
ncbi:MAG TPA: methyltransferase [Spirochaetota bacterium]|nr:methyltransferase [Spirochaetota bacterium]